MQIKPLITAIIFAALTFVCGYGLGCRISQNVSREGTIKERVDTLYLRDTIRVSTAKIVTRRVVDSAYLPADTIRMRDTLFVYLEREQIIWRDTLAEIYASGIRPQIDSVHHFVSERIITREITREVPKRTRWGLGVSAGYGIGSGGLTPYVGVGISYNLLSW